MYNEKGFIVTDHDYRNIMDIATCVIVLYDGGIKQINKTEDFIYWEYIADNHSIRWMLIKISPLIEKNFDAISTNLNKKR